MNVTRELVCGLSGSRTVCPVLMRSASCRYPDCMYPLMSVRPDLWTVNYRTGNRVPRTNIACAFFDRSMDVLSVSYTVHIRCARYTPVTRTLVDRSCPLLVRYLCAPYDFRDDLHRLRDDFHHRINIFFLHFFCPFDVRYLYPLICDSTRRKSMVGHLAKSFQIDICLRDVGVIYAWFTV